ncbi:MAG: thiol reductant ABC exporter subunit CydD [Micrococcales bacterium]|nr:thiol reductant ABC exporter subunit CydD [Micrococcales bacterium]
MKPFDPRLVREHPKARPAVLLLGGLGVLSGIATVVQVFAVARLVTRLVDGGGIAGPLSWALGAFAARAALSALTEWYAARAGAAVSTSLRAALLASWLRRGADERPERTTALTLATQGTSAVEPYVAKYLPTLVQAAVLPPLVVACMFAVDWVSGLIAVLTLPLLPFFAALIGATTRDETAKRWETLSRLSGHFLDVVRGLPTLVGYGRAEKQLSTIGTVSEKHRVATMRTLRLAFMSSAALELLATLSVAIVAVAVGLRLAHGHMELLPGLTAILLAPEAYWPIRRVGAEFHNAADGAEALTTVLDELAATPPDHVDLAQLTPKSAPEGVSRDKSTSPEPGSVSVADVSYAYPGASGPALEGFSADFTSGLTAVTGPSGAGKTTLLDLIAGLRVPSTGTVSRPSGRVHLVTQTPFIAAASVADNLRLGDGRDATDDQLWAALDRVGLRELVASRPERLGMPLGDGGFGLSAGQRARLALARAILADPDVLLLDEPTAHLDPASAGLAHDIIRELAADRTVIAVTHRSELVDAADAVVTVPARKAVTA